MSERLDHKKFATAQLIPDNEYAAIRECRENRWTVTQVSESHYHRSRDPYVTAVFFVEAYADLSRAWVVGDLVRQQRMGRK